MTSLVRNPNDRLSQRRNSIPFDDKYYFPISLAGDLRSLPLRARCLAKNKIQNILNIRWVQTVQIVRVALSNHSIKVFHHPLRLAAPSYHLYPTVVFYLIFFLDLFEWNLNFSKQLLFLSLLTSPYPSVFPVISRLALHYFEHSFHSYLS